MSGHYKTVNCHYERAKVHYERLESLFKGVNRRMWHKFEVSTGMGTVQHRMLRPDKTEMTTMRENHTNRTRRRSRDVAENPPQNYLTTKVTKNWRKEHKERAINE